MTTFNGTRERAFTLTETFNFGVGRGLLAIAAADPIGGIWMLENVGR